MAEAQYAPPASQVDLERRQAIERGESPDEDTPGRDFRVEGNEVSGYYGVDPAYATYANETEAPLRTTEGPEAQVEKRAYSEKRDDEDVTGNGNLAEVPADLTSPESDVTATDESETKAPVTTEPSTPVAPETKTAPTKSAPTLGKGK
jgi:hypothetical protein